MRFASLLAAAAAVLVWAALAGAKSPVPIEQAVVQTGQGPCGVTAARDGNLWVGVYGSGKVLSIDPRRGRVDATVKGLRWACRLVVGPAAVWVTRDRAGEIVRISRGTGRKTRYRVGASPFDVLLANGSVWVSSYDTWTISKIDGATGRMTRVFKDGAHAAGLTSCNGKVWVGHGGEPTWLTRIDPQTNRMVAIDLHAHSPAWPRCIRGELWVTTPDSVLRVDPQSGTVRARIHLGGTPVEASGGPDGLVWVTDKERSRVFRIDPATNAVVDSFAAGPGAYAMARVGDSVWVTSFAGSDIRRYGG
jgi:streptogramin lyase